MSAVPSGGLISSLEKAQTELQAVLRTTETEIASVARIFKDLSGDIDTILNLSAAIVGSVENESVSSVLPKVQTLGVAAKRLIGDRLHATAKTLETVTTEVNVLRQLSLVSSGQAAVAVKTQALSVLTNIEVARLGASGAGFQYLAHELSVFSKSLVVDAQTLEKHTDERKASIEETRRVLSADLPHLRNKLSLIEGDLGKDLAVLDSSLTRLSSTPVQFKTGVEDIAQRIAGVVAAVQAHDITRQQIEHVLHSFALIAAKLRGDGDAGDSAAQELPRAYAGLTIQIYQLKIIKETVTSWTSQIRTCMDGILKVSASEVVGIGPEVVELGREVSSQLSHIELLERESQAYSGRIQRTLGGLSNLTQLVGEHMERAKSVRGRLQLLSFNSIIEGSRLGTRAGAILAIAKSIKEILMEWSEITEQSGRAMKEIMDLVKHTEQVVQVFSQASNEELREAQTQTNAGLDSLRSTAGFAAGQAEEMKSATEKLQAKSADAGKAGDLLEACFGRLDAVLAEIESASHQLETDDPNVKEKYDEADVERFFSAFYTTELEREVLRSALRGGALPVTQQTFAGNSVELF